MAAMKDALSRRSNDRVTQQRQSVHNPKLVAIKSMLEKSFLPHRKGIHREYTSLGYRLEKPILKKWLDVALGDMRLPVRGLKLQGAYTAGLAAKKGATYAKDSIDFILMVKDPKDHPQELKAWGFEAKG